MDVVAIDAQRADVAQVVEHFIGNEEVAGSSPVNSTILEVI